MRRPGLCFFFIDPATTEIYTLSLHDALPIFILGVKPSWRPDTRPRRDTDTRLQPRGRRRRVRSEEHTSELQSHHDLVCRLLLEKKKYRMPLATDETDATVSPGTGGPPDTPRP